ncbi:MAG TPA: methyltransferase domain-containing protein [Blastocatellia bacterium]|nr:methyltransferase domain-containing protein [Blastocatellia bacterium]
MKSSGLKNTSFVKKLVDENDARHFYSSLLQKLLDKGFLTKEMSVLVVCGTTKDKTVFADLGFTNVTISNLDTREPDDQFAPYAWSYQDAENLSFPDAHFDFVAVNAGLHHCHSPHRAMLEMYRVARRAILVIEARESLLLKLAIRLGLAEEYEVCNVVTEGLDFGGVRNSLIPNFVYRWTEREVTKTIASYAPQAEPYVRFYYDLKFPFGSLVDRNRFYLLLAIALYPLAKLASKLFPKQSNLFAFAIKKPRIPEELFPWLKIEDNNIALNMPWIKKRYDVTDK